MRRVRDLHRNIWVGLLMVALWVVPCEARTAARKHAAAKTQAVSCSSKEFAVLSKTEMRSHIRAVAPLDPPSTGKDLHLDGVATLHVAFDRTGKVVCVKVIRGEAVASAAIAKSVKDWKFKPYRSAGKLKPAAGDLAIKYHLRDQGSTAGVV